MGRREKETIGSIQKQFVVESASSEAFFMTFLTGLNSICDLVRPSDVKLLALLCNVANPDTGVVSMTAKVRLEFLKILSITTQSLSNSLQRLREADLIEGERGDFEIHPETFWRGSLEDRRVLLKEMSADLALNYRRSE
jgi:hypothetical protein